MKTIIFIPNITQVNDIGNQVSVQELQNIPNGSCEELLVYDCVDYIDAKQKGEFLNLLISKIRYGGQIILEGVDLEEISRSLMQGQLTCAEARNFLYRGNNIFSASEVISFLESKKLQIEHKRINNYVYTIRAKRPNPSQT